MKTVFAVLLGSAAATTTAVNPIRRVVNLLTSIQEKIEAEAKSQEELFKKYMCYCENGAGDLGESIAAANAKIPQLEASIKESVASKAQLTEDLKNHKAARVEASNSMGAATELRKKEAGAFAKESGDLKTNIAALAGAIAALEKGMGGFLQTSNAASVRRIAIDADMSSTDREVLMAFLQGSTSYAPQSGQITGILKQMKDTMAKSLADCTAAEDESKASFKKLMASKAKEVVANTKAIEAKTVRSGELGVAIAEMQNDAEDTAQQKADDEKFLKDLKKNCATKKDDWATIKAQRALELTAVADTITILSQDDALELFKKTLPTPSLIQMSVSSRTSAQQALALLKQSRKVLPVKMSSSIDLIALALSGKKVNFDKVISMIDELVGVLQQEQEADNAKKELCAKQIDEAEDTAKGLANDVSDAQVAIDKLKDSAATLTNEIKGLLTGIAKLDADVEKEGATRQAEHADFQALMSSNSAAKELLGVAKNRLNKFYNPKMYIAPKAQELTKDEQIAVNLGSETTATPPPLAPGVPAFVQVRSHDQVAPGPPPESFAPFQKKAQASNGVLTLLDNLVADLDKEMQEAQVIEKDSQAEYETFVADATASRAADAKSVTDKEGAKADAEAGLQKASKLKKSKVNELMATEKVLASLHADCNWLVANFDVRKEARAGEVESLNRAKAVLSGADYSFAQTKVTRALRGHW